MSARIHCRKWFLDVGKAMTRLRPASNKILTKCLNILHELAVGSTQSQRGAAALGQSWHRGRELLPSASQGPQVLPLETTPANLHSLRGLIARSQQLPSLAETVLRISTHF